MATLSPDLNPHAEAMFLRALRERTPAEKLEMVDELTAAMREFVWAGLQRRHPLADEHEVERRFARLVLGDNLARRVYDH